MYQAHVEEKVSDGKMMKKSMRIKGAGNREILWIQDWLGPRAGCLVLA
jgi:hypothetical protein